MDQVLDTQIPFSLSLFCDVIHRPGNGIKWIIEYPPRTQLAVIFLFLFLPSLIRHADMLPSETQREIYYRKSPASI